MTITQQLKYLVKSRKKNTELNFPKTVSLNIVDKKSKLMYIVYRGLKNQLTNYRTRNAHSKTRSEVQGGGKKPWKQKGTGRARAGSIRSPLWKGGGVIFGPRKKTYRSKINKKEKRLAIQTTIYNKFPSTIVVDKLLHNINKPSTKSAIQELNTLNIQIKEKNKILLIIQEKTKILYLSFRNIAHVEIIEVKNLNVLSLLKADTILITTDALNKLNTMNN